MKKILLIKTSSLGDILQTLPVVEYIKEKFPSYQIDWVVEERFSDVLLGYSKVDRVLSFDSYQFRKNVFANISSLRAFLQNLRKTRYDYIFDLQGNCKSGLITLFSKGKKKVGFDFSSLAEWPSWFTTNKHITVSRKINIRKQYLSLIQQGLGLSEDFSNGSQEITLFSKEPMPSLSFPRDRHKILLCPHSRWKNKELPEKNLRELISLFESKLPAIFYWVWSSEEERQYVEKVSFSTPSQVLPRLSLANIQKVMKKMDLIISVDSSLLHLAGLTSTPTIGLFGPSEAFIFSPTGAHSYSIQGRCLHNKMFCKRCPSLRICKEPTCMDIDATAIFSLWESFSKR